MKTNVEAILTTVFIFKFPNSSIDISFPTKQAIPGSIVPLVATANMEAAIMNMLPISSRRMPNHL